jgi:putative OPT family oligopeptide transporter
MTICTVLFSGAVMLLIGMAGQQGIVAALCVAGVVCCAACTAGDVSQDLKTGYLVGGTPRAQQLTMILGVVVSSFVMAPVLTLLHKAYTIGSPALNAPQAALFAKIAEAMFGKGGLPWTLIGIGAALGLLILWADNALQKRGGPFRLYLMPVAVGLYLPFVNGLPILLGGLVAWLVKRKMAPQGEVAAKRAEHQGVLIASGLIAGEAIAGIVLAAFIGGGFEMPLKLIDPESTMGAVTSALMVFGVLAGLYKLSLSTEPAGAASDEK